MRVQGPELEPIEDGVGTEALIPSCDVDALMAHRDAIVRHAEAVAELLTRRPAGFPDLWLNEGKGLERFDVKRVVHDADRSAWWTLIQGTGLWDVMDHEARTKWRDELDKGEHPEFTRENAEATIQGLYEQRKAMVMRGVANVYMQLDASYKSNQPMGFGPRVIIKRVADTSYKSIAFVDHRTADKLDDLERLLRLLRGLPQASSQTSAYRRLCDAMRFTSDKPKVWTAEFDFFAVKVFKNGNGHLTFKHDVDRDRLNRVLALYAKNQIGGRRQDSAS